MFLHRHIRLFGIVQGVGFRPFVSRLAVAHHIAGTVANKSSCVEIEAEGLEGDVEAFCQALVTEAPERSVILKTEIKAADMTGYDDFTIIESQSDSGDIFVSPDIAICPTCLKEIYDPADRRFAHPFNNCTACGPRLTILKAMPYDRKRTSMRKFPMCPSCYDEYTDPATRRYHAQPTACPSCGPALYTIPMTTSFAGGEAKRDHDALQAARCVIRQGGIVAIKGIGGYHLCCDAENDAAVRRLRVLKQRPMKPFAVMMRDMSVIEANCEVEDAMRPLITGPQKPILLLKRRRDKAHLSEMIAPGNPYIGVMLPYTPLHALIFNDPKDETHSLFSSLVMTSANPTGQPICRCDEEAVTLLRGIADLILSHDRDILTRADDSVMAWQDERPLMIRRSRGYAPLPLGLSKPADHTVLALGGDLKNAFCLGSHEFLYPSAYLSDMEEQRSLQALGESHQRMEQLLDIAPEMIVVDKHPKYHTAIYGRKLAEERGIPVVEIQHHFAHLVSCLVENDCYDRVAGAIFDGTGYGDDGTIWGGEFFVSDRQSYERRACLKRTYLAGGDRASREGYRSACAWLKEAFEDEAEDYGRRLSMASDRELKAQFAMIAHRFNGTLTSSGGRLFDAVSAMLGICRESTFEGEAAMALQYAAEEALESHSGLIDKENSASLKEKMASLIECDASSDGIAEINPVPLIKDLVIRRLEGADIGELALAFHRGLATLIVCGIERAAENEGIKKAALSGGVMTNTLLLSLCRQKLEARGYEVLTQSLVSPGDNGLALGQAAAARYPLKPHSL